MEDDVDVWQYAILELHARNDDDDAVMRVSVCLCVYLSVTFVSCVKTNKHIFKIVSPSGSQAILVFPYQTARQYSNGNPLNEALNAGGVGRNRDSEPISVFTASCQRYDCG